MIHWKILHILKVLWKSKELIGIAIIAIIAIILGFSVAWFIQDIKIDMKETKIELLEKNIAICQTANITNQEAIKKLQKEIVKINNICSIRLKVKDTLIREIRYIDNLRLNNKETVVNENENNISINADDPVLYELNSMFNKAGSKN